MIKFKTFLEAETRTPRKKGQHKDAMNCTKLIIERIVPSLKASELKIKSNDDSGFVYLPPQKEVESE